MRKMIYSLSHRVAPELWMFIRWAGAADEWECKKAASRASREERQAHIFLAHVLMLSMKKGEVHLLG